ncbi:hypothetical protein AB6A40_003046 [Gnathostoma spinigerum]|uniref:Uncharacterized protein n=1 Tax=Gnathostoma spinigerum TaxID=75299 RepID=A0ABD6EI28_9BILA
MFSAVYDLFFGNSNDSVNSTQKENVGAIGGDISPIACNKKSLISQNSPSKVLCNRIAKDEDWIFVENCSGRSSPVFVPFPELQDIDAMSIQTAVSHSESIPSSAELRSAENLKLVKSITARRTRLEQTLFDSSVVPTSKKSDAKTGSVSNKWNNAKLNRSTAANYVAAESKIKQRSKKGGILNSGRNNNRKVNNIH